MISRSALLWEPSIAVAHDDADAVFVFLDRSRPASSNGHPRRCHGKLREPRHPPRISPVEVLNRVEVRRLPGEVTGKVGRVGLCNRAYARFSLHEAAPELVDRQSRAD